MAVVKLALDCSFTKFSDFELLLQEYCIEKMISVSIFDSNTVKSYNKKIKKEKSKLPVELRYLFVVYRCIHSGTYETKSKGKRKSATFRDECPFMLKLNVRDKKLRITTFDENHTHAITDELFEKYPKQRACNNLGLSAKIALDTMLDNREPAKDCLSAVQKITGRYESVQGIYNYINRKHSQPIARFNPAQRLLKLIEQETIDGKIFSQFDINAGTKELEFIFWQTAKMQKCFDIAPEFVLCDSTYRLNKSEMPLVVLQVMIFLSK